MLKKVFNLSSSTLIISLLMTSVASAEMTDARSVGTGGATLGVTNNAFSALRNPASMSDIEGTSLMLPLSPTITINNNLSGFKSYLDLSTSLDNQLKESNADNFLENLPKLSETLTGSEVGQGLVNLNDSIRFETTALVPIFGYTGTPSEDINFMGNPITLGVNLWTKANIVGDVQFGSDGNAFFKQVPSLFDNGLNIVSEVTKVQKNISSLSDVQLSIPNITEISSTNSAIDQAEDFQKNTLQPLLNIGDETIQSFNKASEGVGGLITTLQTLNNDNQSLNGNIFGDGHGVIALSGSTKVYKNEMIDVSVGVNLKGFFFPGNISKNSIMNTDNLPLPIEGNILPTVIQPKVNLGKFDSVDEIQTVLDNQFSPIIKDAEAMINTAKKVDAQLSETLPKARENPILVLGDVQDIQTIGLEMQNQYNSLIQKVGPNGSNLQEAGTSLQNTVIKDLNNINMSYKQVSDVAPFGVGVDIGAQARIMENITVGLVLENPLVIWPAKVSETNVTFNTDNLSNGNNDLSQLLNVEQGEKTDFNYNLTEPLTIRLGGGYKLDSLSEHLSNSTFLADIEQVFNGRPLAMHLGLEKGWALDAADIYGRLGSQLGGIGNMFTVGFGTRVGNFNLDLGYGASNPINPLNSKAVIVSLSSSVNF